MSRNLQIEVWEDLYNIGEFCFEFSRNLDAARIYGRLWIGPQKQFLGFIFWTQTDDDQLGQKWEIPRRSWSLIQMMNEAANICEKLHPEFFKHGEDAL